MEHAMKNKIILLALILSGCGGAPYYLYENTHALDSELGGKNVCIVIDNENSTYHKGTQKLAANPFVGDEDYDADQVAKTPRPYDYQFVNAKCDAPVTLTRRIKVSGIVYPDTCTESVYAGSIYTGSTTYSSSRTSSVPVGHGTVGYNTGVSSTRMHSRPVYRTRRYTCNREQYMTDIEFYRGTEYVGSIRNKYWDTNDTNETIDTFTEEFIDIITRGAR